MKTNNKSIVEEMASIKYLLDECKFKNDKNIKINNDNETFNNLKAAFIKFKRLLIDLDSQSNRHFMQIVDDMYYYMHRLEKSIEKFDFYYHNK